MSVRTNFKGNIFTGRKQGKKNKFNYSKSNSETLLYFFFNNRLFSHIQSFNKVFPVFCINSELLQILFAKKTSQPSVNGRI